jgi:hypothetical protein
VRRPCAVRGCRDDARTKGWCSKHYQRFVKHGDPLITQKAANGEGGRNHVGHKVTYRNGRRAAEHIHVCEAALGKRLPRGAQVLHVDGDVENNRRDNLVLCGSHAYHALLFLRARAYDATGNPDLRQCSLCKQWDEPTNLYIRQRQNTGTHRRCRQAARKSPLAVMLTASMRPTSAGLRMRWIR